MRPLLLLLFPTALLAQYPTPTLVNVYPPGGKAGAEVEVTLRGDNLDGLKDLIFSQPGIEAEQVTLPADEIWPEPRPDGLKFRVKVAPDVAPGLYDVRAVSWYGVSTPRLFAVGAKDGPEELVEGKEAHHAPEAAIPVQLEQVVYGTPTADLSDYYKVSLKAGQRVLVHCWADRLDSKMDPALTVQNAAGEEVESARDYAGLDPLLDFTAETAGDYFIGVHDFLFRGGDPSHYYRLQVSARPWIDAVYPLAGPGATRQSFTLYGRNLPGGKPEEGASWKGARLEALKVEIDVPSEGSPVPLTGLSPMQTFAQSFEYALPESNPVRIGIASSRVEMEDPALEDQKVPVPCEVAGRMNEDGDLDRYRFSAKAGEKLWVELISHRLSTPLDASIAVAQISKDKEGKETEKVLAESDDFSIAMTWPGFDVRSRDSGVLLNVPADGDYRVLVLNNSGKASPLHAYQLAITPAEADYQLLAIADRNHQEPKQAWPGTPFLRAGGTAVVRVVALRRGGFTGPIRVSATGLPEGVTCPDAVIWEKQDEARLVLTATKEVQDWIGSIEIAGHAVAEEGREIHRPALTGALAWGSNDYTKDRMHSRLTAGIPLVVSAQPAPLILEPAEEKVWEVELGKELQIPVKLTRSDKSPVHGAITVAPTGLPAFTKPPTLSIADKANEGVLKVSFKPDNANKPYAAEGSFLLQASATMKHKPWEEGALHAEEIRKQVEANAAKLAAAKTSADKALADAEAALKAAEANAASASPDAKAGATAAVEEARRKVETARQTATAADALAKRAEAAKKTAGDAAKAAAARAKELDVKITAWSRPVNLKIVEPPQEKK